MFNRMAIEVESLTNRNEVVYQSKFNQSLINSWEG